MSDSEKEQRRVDVLKEADVRAAAELTHRSAASARRRRARARHLPIDHDDGTHFVAVENVLAIHANALPRRGATIFARIAWRAGRVIAVHVPAGWPAVDVL